MHNDDVGYGRPPKNFQFKKGQSGNPKGRPKRGRPDVGEIVSDVINGEASYSEGGRQRIATRSEVSVRALLKQALTGSVAAAEQILNLLKNAERTGGQRVLHVRVVGGLPKYPEQTGDQKMNDASQLHSSAVQTSSGHSDITIPDNQNGVELKDAT